VEYQKEQEALEIAQVAEKEAKKVEQAAKKEAILAEKQARKEEREAKQAARQLAKDQALAEKATRQSSQKTTITKPKEAKGASKKASKGTDAIGGSKEGIESVGKGIGSSSGSQGLEVVGEGESPGKRVVQRPQRYRD
jgi:hypothetical protein